MTLGNADHTAVNRHDREVAGKIPSNSKKDQPGLEKLAEGRPMLHVYIFASRYHNRKQNFSKMKYLHDDYQEFFCFALFRFFCFFLWFFVRLRVSFVVWL